MLWEPARAIPPAMVSFISDGEEEEGEDVEVDDDVLLTNFIYPFKTQEKERIGRSIDLSVTVNETKKERQILGTATLALPPLSI